MVDPKGEKRRNYPKCVPLAKARSMSKSEKSCCCKKKEKSRKKSRKGKRPNYAKT